MQEVSQKMMSLAGFGAFFFRGDKTVYIAEKVTLKSNSETNGFNRECI